MIIQALENLLIPAVEALGYEWWGCVFQQRARNALLRVYIDKSEGGVTVEDCAAASHQMTGVLSLNNPIQGSYTLEVSSPGMDRPLFTLAQYERFVGQVIKLRLQRPLQDRRNFQGVMQEVRGTEIVLLVDHESVTVDFNNIERGNLVPDFSQFD